MNLPKQFIPLPSRFFERPRPKRTADAFLGPGRRVDDVVDEPRAVVIPEVMVQVLRIGANA